MIESLMWLTMCVYFEARGEDTAGQVAVAQVVLNRSEQRKKSIIEIIKEPKQFSFFNDGVLPDIKDPESFIQCARSVALAYMDRMKGDTMKGANFYFNPNIVQPSWADNMEKISLIGNHLFLKG